MRRRSDACCRWTTGHGRSSASCPTPPTSACCSGCSPRTTGAASPIATSAAASTCGCRCRWIPGRCRRDTHPVLVLGRAGRRRVAGRGATGSRRTDDAPRARVPFERGARRTPGAVHGCRGRARPRRALDPARGRLPGARHRLRERGQPVAGARHGAGARGRRPDGYRRGPWTPGPAVHGREHAPGRHRRRAGDRRGLRFRSRARGACTCRGPAADDDRRRRSRARHLARGDRVCGPRLRSRAASPVVAPRRESCALVRRAHRNGSGEPRAPAIGTGHRRDCARRRADRRCRA